MSQRSRFLDALWWLGSVALLIAPASIWSSIDLQELRQPPISPLDRSTYLGAAHWRLVANAAALIPPGASVTFVAATPEDEMSMFMIAVGVMPRVDVRPSSYWSDRTAEGRDAEYVIAYRAGPDIEPGAVVIARWPEGLLLQRPPRP